MIIVERECDFSYQLLAFHTSERFRWLSETFGMNADIDISGVWKILISGYAFKNEADRNWFLLRFS